MHLPLQVRTVEPSPVRVPAGEVREVVASCATGEVATGGGVADSHIGGTNEINLGVEDTGSPSFNPSQWEFNYNNPGPNDVNINAIVQCAKLVDAP